MRIGSWKIEVSGVEVLDDCCQQYREYYGEVMCGIYVKQQIGWQYMYDGIGYVEIVQQNVEEVEECCYCYSEL